MSQINSNTKDEFQVVFLLSCFVGHPVHPGKKMLRMSDEASYLRSLSELKKFLFKKVFYMTTYFKNMHYSLFQVL